MRIAEDLRRAVLQAAIEGKLTDTEHREYYNSDIPFI